MTMNISNRIKKQRALLGLTQSQAAARAGISQQSLQKIEDGKTKSPRSIIELAKALECDAEWLLNGKLLIGKGGKDYVVSSLRKIPLIPLGDISCWSQFL